MMAYLHLKSSDAHERLWSWPARKGAGTMADKNLDLPFYQRFLKQKGAVVNVLLSA